MPGEIHAIPKRSVASIVYDHEFPGPQRKSLGTQRLEAPRKVARPRIVCANYNGEHATHNLDTNQILSWYSEQVGHGRHLSSGNWEKRESMPGQTFSYRNPWSNPLLHEIGFATEAHLIRK